MNVPNNSIPTEIGQQLDSAHFETNGCERTVVASTTTGVYELITCTCLDEGECKHKQSCLKLLDLGVRDPLWTLRKNNSNRSVLIENGYDIHQYQPACVVGMMKMTDVTPSKSVMDTRQGKDEGCQHRNGITFRSRFYTVTCHNVTAKSKTVVSVVHNDVNSNEYCSGHAANNLELIDTKILQIIPASQGRYLLLGTKIVIIQVRPESTGFPEPSYGISLLQTSAAPNLPLAVSGYLEFQSLVVSCPYAARSRDTQIRIPLPHCLR